MLLGLLLIPYYTWRKHGDDPTPKNPVVAEYSPPKNLSAAEMVLLLGGKFTTNTITASIFELGVKGLLEINNDNGLTFIKKREITENDQLTGLQKYLFDKIFCKNTTQQTKASSLKHALSGAWTQKGPVFKKLQQDGYYQILPLSGASVFLGILAGIEIFTGLQFLSAGNSIVGGCFIASAVMTFIFVKFMAKKTQKGVETAQAIKGFKEYLKIAEKDRIKFHNPPQKTIQLFEKFLPFAVALGVEKEWSKSFKDLLEKASSELSYFHSNFDHYSGFKAFSKSMSSMTSTTHSAATSRSSSGTGHSSSGFSGGFSGGGGGGGGGGSW